MEKWLVYSLLAVLVLYFMVGVIRRRQSAREKAEKLMFLRAQISRALAQIRTGGEDEVLAGLQTIMVLNDPQALLQGMPIIDELRGSPNSRIAKAATLAFEQLKSRLAVAYGDKMLSEGMEI